MKVKKDKINPKKLGKSNKSSKLHLANCVWAVVAVVLSYVAYKLIFNDNIDDTVFFNSTLNTTKHYDSRNLTRYKSAPLVPAKHGLPGEMGQEVILPAHMKELSDERFKEHAFNIIISDMISENRSLTDIRHPGCKKINYPAELPNTSIIIVFHNEAWSTLTRTIWSVINRSPNELISEIILVDDASDKEYLGQQLDEFVGKLPVKCFVIRQTERLGLIQARLTGSAQATGQVLTFLDAHCECSEQWLEPLLTRIARNRFIVPAPIIDVISDETFYYATSASNEWGGFDWRFTFKWVKVPEREYKRINNNPTTPVRPPTMAGGLFSIDREFFYEIGSYDEGMQIWGAENLEMSFRIWMCGGILEMVPCSRVGHVFRKFTPYKFPGGSTNTVNYNTDRLVNVWIDEWVTFYNRANTGRNLNPDNDVSDRIALREKLQCKSFKWYLENVFPEYKFPMDNYLYMGEISNVETKTCLENTPASKTAGAFTMYHCHKLGGNQMFVYTKDFELLGDGLCFDAHHPVGAVNATVCSGNVARQKWIYDHESRTFVHANSGSCLTRPIDKEVLLRKCDGSLGQQWLLSSSNEQKDEF